MRARGNALPRVLAGIDPSGRPLSLVEHQAQNGPLPSPGTERLLEEVARSGLRGRGGADFPTARKLQAVAGRRSVSAVVVNGSETEPASQKDRVLLACLPHLVLDGAVLAAEAVGAAEVIVKLREGDKAVQRAIAQAIAERDDGLPVSVVVGGEGYVSGEESAVINFLSTRRALPQFVPPRPYERGYRGRPTLIQNAETLAQLALIARCGAEWFRQLGTDADPGTFLTTISGAVVAPGVYELGFGTSLAELVAAAGGWAEPVQAFLVGGYFGRWIRAEEIARLRFSRAELASVGLALGSGVLIALGAGACGLHESARLANYLAGESTGQCGPCVNGLRSISESFQALVDGAARPGDRDRVLRWARDVEGRGACHHPDGVVRMIRSALEVFGDELAAHARGRCTAAPAGLPTTRHRSEDRARRSRPEDRARR